MRRTTMIPANRFWARIDRFECECPSCGHVISPYHGKVTGATPDPDLPHQLPPSRLRDISRYQPPQDRTSRPRKLGNLLIRSLIYNPLTQRVRCPWCYTVFVAGLILYPVPSGSPATLYAPPDIEPNARQRQQLRSFARGWYAKRLHGVREPVNVYVENTCSCPPDDAWNPSCPVHGAHRPEEEPKRPEREGAYNVDPDNPYDFDEVD